MQTTRKLNSVSLSIALFMAIFIVQADTPSSAKAPVETMSYIKMWVDGMACPFCAYGMEKRIKKIDGLVDFYVDINEGFITFGVPAKSKPTEDELKEIVKEAGFTLRKIEYAEKPYKEE